MKNLGRYFVKGLLLILPIVLTLYLTVWVVESMDGLFQGVVFLLFGQHIPGLGLLLTAGSIVLVGVLGSHVVTRSFFDWLNQLMARIPFLESVYGTIQEAVSFLIGDRENGFQTVVLVKQPGDLGYTIGLLTRQQLPELTTLQGEDRIAVYVPMSYQIGGFTYLVRRDQIIELPEMTPQQALRFALVGGLGKGHKVG
ncbi:MAG: DUF502 domain-containing protein [Pseudomonadota bacterium]